jgi:hypothetical protein
MVHFTRLIRSDGRFKDIDIGRFFARMIFSEIAEVAE